MRHSLFASLLILSACATTAPQPYDIVIRNGVIYDGRGGDPVRGDLAIRGDRIAAVGVVRGSGRAEIDAHGLAVAPGFINIMSQGQEGLIADGRAMSDIKQGVTTEIMGEAESMGPLSPAMKKEFVEGQADIKYDVDWTTLDEYLQSLVRRGVSPNVGSFLGAATPRVFVMGRTNRAPTPEETAGSAGPQPRRPTRSHQYAGSQRDSAPRAPAARRFARAAWWLPCVRAG